MVLASLKASNREDFHIGKTKTYVVVTIRRVVVVTIRYTQVLRVVVPTPAPIHSVRAFLLAAFCKILFLSS